MQRQQVLEGRGHVTSAAHGDCSATTLDVLVSMAGDMGVPALGLSRWAGGERRASSGTHMAWGESTSDTVIWGPSVWSHS